MKTESASCEKSRVRSVQFAMPTIESGDINTVVEVLKSGMLSMGEKTPQFEQAMATYVGVKHAVAVSSGTAALHLAVVASEIMEGDEVITTPLSFIPSANCLLYEKVKPDFVDIELDTLGPCPQQIRAHITNKTRAILFVNLFHQPVHIAPIRNIADQYRLTLIEDACETLGAETSHQRSGALGDIAAFGFYPNKQITTGEGGMITTNSDKLAEACRCLRNQGRAVADSWLSHSKMGYNYRLNEMSAALGLSQLSRIDQFINAREAVAKKYSARLKNIEGVSAPHISKHTTRTSWFAYTIQLSEHLVRPKVMAQLAELGVPTRDYFNCIHLQKPYREKYGFHAGEFPNAEKFAKQNIALPFYPNMTETDIEYVCSMLKKVIELSE